MRLSEKPSEPIPSGGVECPMRVGQEKILPPRLSKNLMRGKDNIMVSSER